jgi:hypothetical protein
MSINVEKLPDVKLTIHLHLVLRLRIHGTITLLPLYVFMVWTGTTLPLLFNTLGYIVVIYQLLKLLSISHPTLAF